MKKYLILLLLFFNFLTIFSQTLSGKITDKENGETLFGVSIYLKNTSVGTSTNEYGFYSLSLNKGAYTVVYDYLGFYTIEKEILIETDITLNIELSEETTSLNEVTISAEKSKARSRIKVAQMSVNSMGAKTIKRTPVVFGELDILKTITLLPGVTNNGEGSAGFNVRGGAADQNLILLDEATIYNTSHLFGFFSIFNADAIKSLKLYKGGMPAKYGGRVSSVLDVFQKDGNTKSYHTKGGVGLISSRLLLEGPLQKDKSSFLLAGRTSYVNMFIKMAKDEKIKDNRISFYDLNTKLSYTFNDNNKLFLSAYFGQDNFKMRDLIKSNYGNTSINLRWNHLFTEKLFSNFSLIYSKYDYKLDFPLFEYEWLSAIKNTNIKYDFNYYISNKTTLNFGLSAIDYQFIPGEINPTTEDSQINSFELDEKYAIEPAIYVEAQQKIGEKLNIQYGLRLSSFYRIGNQNLKTYTNDEAVVYDADLDIYEAAKPIDSLSFEKNELIKSFYGLEPRISLSYQINEQNAFKASYQRVNQYIHLISNTNSATPLDVWVPSGKYIKPQIADQFAIGFFKNFDDEMFSTEIESFYKTVSNRIDYIDGAKLIGNNHIETELLSGESRSYGLEFLFRKNEGKLTGWLSYTLSRSEQRVLGRHELETGINNEKWYNTPYDRTHDISLTLDYQLGKNWHIGSNFIFQTGRPTNYPSGQYDYNGFTIPVYTTRNAERLPAYHRLDISATWSPKKTKNKWKSEWVIGVYNAYNRKNAASISFDKNSETGYNEAVKTSIFGIMPAITYNFKF
jgi:hypothetical protein